MEIIWTRTKTIVTVSVLLLVVAALVVKKVWFPTVDEKFFSLDYQRLQLAPAGVLILRPTHFSESRRAGAFSAPMQTKSGQYDPNQMRIVGRNVPFDELIAQAYRCQPSRVFLPYGTPTNNYDFLVTVKDKPVEKLQAVIKKKLGYVARWQDQESEVFQLKVQIPNHSGLRPSASDQSGGSNYKGGKLHFTHAHVQNVLWMVERSLGKPVEDKTGLTGFYDYALTWNWQVRRNGLDMDEIKKSLSELGLALVSTTETMPMMTVERAK
jgi:uncharacterized protein (TIGR03435 family)